MLTDPACDPAAIHRDRLMIESLLAQAPSRDDAFSMSGAPTRAYMDYWHIVYLYLCDDRVRDALWGDTRRAYHLQERFREIVWKYKHPWAIAYHGRGVVQVINTKIAAACRKPLVVLPR